MKRNLVKLLAGMGVAGSVHGLTPTETSINVEVRGQGMHRFEYKGTAMLATSPRTGVTQSPGVSTSSTSQIMLPGDRMWGWDGDLTKPTMTTTKGYVYSLGKPSNLGIFGYKAGGSAAVFDPVPNVNVLAALQAQDTISNFISAPPPLAIQIPDGATTMKIVGSLTSQPGALPQNRLDNGLAGVWAGWFALASPASTWVAEVARVVSSPSFAVQKPGGGMVRFRYNNTIHTDNQPYPAATAVPLASTLSWTFNEEVTLGPTFQAGDTVNFYLWGFMGKSRAPWTWSTQRGMAIGFYHMPTAGDLVISFPGTTGLSGSITSAVNVNEGYTGKIPVQFSVITDR